VPVVYADASALVKLVRDEPESGALRSYLSGAGIVTSELALTEVPRATRRAAADDPRLPLELLLHRAGEVLESVGLLPLGRDILLAAGAITEPGLRALDAIHVAAAISLAPIDTFVTYDERQAAAARLAGLRVVAPGA
jgi:predicted nucleic acid-binding protein